MESKRSKTGHGSFRPIPVETLQIGTRLPCDIYIKVEGQVTIFRRAGVVLDGRLLHTLMDRRVQGVLVTAQSHGEQRYHEYTEAHLWDVADHAGIPLRRRADIIYRCALSLMGDAFSLSLPGNIWERTRRVAGQMARFLREKPGALTELLAVAAHEFSLAAHAVNVCFLSVALALRMGIDNRDDLDDLSAGCLLHDIGQSRINRRILLKRGLLTQEEYDLIKRAPAWGVEILRDTRQFGPNVLIAVLQHQERMDGSGYPVGLTGPDIHLYGRICAIAEAFDSITSHHVYREAIDGYPALVTMRREAGKFDPILLDAFIGLLKRQNAAVELHTGVTVR